MEDLIIEASEYTPKVVLKPDKQIFCFFGNSFPVNPSDFYQPILDWFSEFFKSANLTDELIVNFDFDYVNTSSSKQIAYLLMFFESLIEKDKILINWYYDPKENDMLETGEKYLGYANLRFKFTDKTIETPIQIALKLI